MNSSTFVSEMNGSFKDLELIDPIWLRIVEEQTARIQEQDAQILRLVEINRKLLRQLKK
jgi:hypothetical protein